jgi:hypothetical protein
MAKKLHELAGDLYDALETRKRNNGKEFICLKDGSPDWMTEVISTAHGDAMPDDTIYGIIERAAGALHDAEAEDEDAAQEAIYELEPDCYTNDLTAWLHKRVDHVYYLTEVLEDGGCEDGFQLLMAAQSKQIQEIGGQLVSALVAYQSELEDEEE